jgi:hypothetical protein
MYLLDTPPPSSIGQSTSRLGGIYPLNESFEEVGGSNPLGANFTLFFTYSLDLPPRLSAQAVFDLKKYAKDWVIAYCKRANSTVRPKRRLMTY